MSLGPLALVGGREWEVGCSFDASLIEAVSAEEVVVIAAAAAYERPDRVIDKACAWFDQLDVKVVDSEVLTRADAENAELADRIRSARFVYLSDGSAMHLRSVLKDSAVLSAIKEMWHSGGAVAGSAAGAMVLTDPMVDPRGGAFTLGLGLVAAFTAIPRWDRWTPEMSQRMIKLAPAGTLLAEIPERTAVIRQPDHKWRAEGVGEVLMVRDGQLLKTPFLKPV